MSAAAGEFGRWIAHFEDNKAVHERVDGMIAFDAQCHLPDSVRARWSLRCVGFQLGESGDGEQLLRKADDAGDREYRSAAESFVEEERQHAALLLRLLAYLDAGPMSRHWSDSVFVRLRRSLGLRTELMVLTVAEVIALVLRRPRRPLPGPRGACGGRANPGRRVCPRALPPAAAAGRLRQVPCCRAVRRGRIVVGDGRWRRRGGGCRPWSAVDGNRLPAYQILPPGTGRLHEGWPPMCCA